MVLKRRHIMEIIRRLIQEGHYPHVLDKIRDSYDCNIHRQRTQAIVNEMANLSLKDLHALLRPTKNNYEYDLCPFGHDVKLFGTSPHQGYMLAATMMTWSKVVCRYYPFNSYERSFFIQTKYVNMMLLGYIASRLKNPSRIHGSLQLEDIAYWPVTYNN